MQHSKEIKGVRCSLNIYFDQFNERIRVDEYSGNIDEIDGLIQDHGQQIQAQKLIVKSHGEHLQSFMERGYELEAVLKGFFRGSDVYFLAKFLSEKRQMSSNWLKAEKIFSDVQLLPEDTKIPLHLYTLQRAELKDAERLASLYENVFPVYPVPLQKPEYIRKSLEKGTVYLFIEKNNEIISAASAEVDKRHGNAELTDCATHPSFRGGGLMKQLLSGLEKELIRQQIYCAYTISRSLSFGMNAAFKQLGYHYGGRLVNNCYILDKMEDMNVWWKDLSSE